MHQQTHTPGTRAVLTRRVSFSPVNRGQYGRDASLPATMPVEVETIDGETRLYAWIDAPLEGPADYFYIAAQRPAAPAPIDVPAPLPEQPSIPARLVYNVREAAALLGVGKDYLYERINNGEIPIVQFGTELKFMRRIAHTDLQAFIDARREQVSQ